MRLRSRLPEPPADPTTVAALRDQAQTIAVFEAIQRPGLGHLSAVHRLKCMDFLGHAAAVAIAVMAMEMFRTAH